MIAFGSTIVPQGDQNLSGARERVIDSPAGYRHPKLPVLLSSVSIFPRMDQ